MASREEQMTRAMALDSAVRLLVSYSHTVPDSDDAIRVAETFVDYIKNGSTDNG